MRLQVNDRVSFGSLTNLRDKVGTVLELYDDGDSVYVHWDHGYRALHSANALTKIEAHEEVIAHMKREHG